MIVFPNCKINLGLFITEKRADGFHNLETIFYPIGLSDALEIVKTDGDFEFNISGINIPSRKEDNICVKAYNLVKNKYNIGNVKMHLLKKIPVGSGLGGGSSDAVSALKILDSLFELNMTSEKLYSFARQLGSDCSFFVDNKPKLAFEKGDKFEDIDISFKGLHLAVVVPPFAVSTAEAYKMVKTFSNRESLRKIIKLPVQDWKYELYNDFEYTVFNRYSQIASIKEKLYKMGALYASMSGSGSAVYGFFKEKPLMGKLKDCIVWQQVCEI